MQDLSVSPVGAHLAPTAEELVRLRQVALGEVNADLVIENVRVLCLATREILDRQVVISGAFIAAVAPAAHQFSAKERFDGGGAYLAPGFIDTHIHIEYSLLTPGEFARCVLPLGTTCVLADPNCVGNVLGEAAMQWVGQTDTPLKILQQVSHRIPRAPELELGGAVVGEIEQFAMLDGAHTVGVGESVPFGFDERAARFQAHALAIGKRCTGHSARVANEDLWAYAATGISDDHNAFEADEVLDRLRLGMMITVMAGSMNDNVPFTFADVQRVAGALDGFSFCADDKHVGDLARGGHIDHHVRSSIALGVPILDAYRMATFNAARFYRLDHLIGCIAPTRRADLLLIEDLQLAKPAAVWVDGQLAVHSVDGACVARFPNSDSAPEWLRNTVHLSPAFSPATFSVNAEAAAGEVAVVRAMEMYDGYFKREFEAELAVLDGNVCADPSQDVAKVAVVDRHHGTDTAACGFVRGFALQRGALAATTNCENQNLVVLGTNDDDMAVAGRALADCGGGYVAVADGEVLACLELPLAGIMADRPWEQVLMEADAVNHAAGELGCAMDAPFMILAFVGLAGVPDLGLTERGLVDAFSQKFVPVVQCCRCPLHAHDLTRGEVPGG